MFFRGIARKLAKIIVVSYALWILLSTAVPQGLLKSRISTVGEPYPLSHDLNTETIVKAGLEFKSIYLIIAHPDDELMFFGPTILQLSNPRYSNTIKLISFSNGDYDNLGALRAKELARSCQIFGIEHEMLNFEDDPNQEWSADVISDTLKEIISRDQRENIVLLTFDQNGISGHLNHISLFYGVEKFVESSAYKVDRFFVLKTWDLFIKYSFNLFTNWELTQRIYATVTGQSPDSSSSLKIFNDLNQLFVNLAAMTAGHFTQMVYFRYGWVFLSKYFNSNELLEITID